MRKLLLIAAGTALLALPALAMAAMSSNTVELTAELAKQGRRANVEVLLGCDRAQRARLRVTLTQRSGAVAQGRRKVRCTTERKRFAVKAKVRRRTRLAAGEATVCVLALTRDDARQWCKDITLE